MKIQNRLYILKGVLASMAVVLFTGCDDYLDITPPSQIAPEHYLWSEEQLSTYILTYYLPANTDGEKNHGSEKEKYGGRFKSHSGSGGESYHNDDLETDIATGGNTNNRYAKEGLWTVGTSGGYWNFENIYALNYYINTVQPRYEENRISGNEIMVKHLIGEGYFLRAQEYFFRLCKLGDFPIVTENLADDMEVLIEASVRKPRNEVARFILSDLDKAIELLSNSPTSGKLRITKNAAYLLKARVALFEGTWEKYHAGTALVPNGQGWPGAAKNSGYQFPSGSLDNEISFFLEQAMDAASKVADAVSLASNTKQLHSDAVEQAIANNNNPYYKMFATTDPSGYDEVIMYRKYVLNIKSHSFNHFIGGGGSRGWTNQMEKGFLMQNGLPFYATGSGYAGDDFIANTKQDRDWRWRLFMKAPGDIKTIENTADYVSFEAAPLIYSSDNKSATSTGYNFGKGYNYNGDFQSIGNDLTAAVVFRAAEAYLIYLEACYVKNGSLDSKAQQYWKTIRERAGVDTDFQKTIDATNMSIEAQYDWGAYSAGALVDATLYNIRRERKNELMEEGFRYDDLLRWRAMDQLNGFQIEGFKVWGPTKDLYPVDESGKSVLVYNESDATNTVSSPDLSDYVRPYQVQSGNRFYSGLFYHEAYYLEPIAISHFLITAPDGKTISDSPLYQNPNWPVEGGAGPLK